MAQDPVRSTTQQPDGKYLVDYKGTQVKVGVGIEFNEGSKYRSVNLQWENARLDLKKNKQGQVEIETSGFFGPENSKRALSMLTDILSSETFSKGVAERLGGRPEDVSNLIASGKNWAKDVNALQSNKSRAPSPQ